MKMRQRNQASLIFSMSLPYFETTFHSLTRKVTFLMQEKNKCSWTFTVHAMTAVFATKPTKYVNSKILMNVYQAHQVNIGKSKENNCFKNLYKMWDHMLQLCKIHKHLRGKPCIFRNYRLDAVFHISLKHD